MDEKGVKGNLYEAIAIFVDLREKIVKLANNI